MHPISELIEQLRQSVLSIDCSAQGSVQIVQSISFSETTSLLSWLEHQPIFPSFYWHHRDNREEVVACGAVIKFADVNGAHEFIRQAPQSPMRIWGLNAFEPLSNAAKTDSACSLFLPRVEICRTPGLLTAAVNLYSEGLLKEDDLNKALALLDAFVVPENCQDSPVQQVNVIAQSHQPEQKAWCGLLTKALTEIAQNRFEKVVLARRSQLTLSETLSPVQFIERSKRVNHGCFHFMMRFDQNTAFLGSSPELLFSREDKRLLTEALAGTVADSEDSIKAGELAEWLLYDDKNQHENLLVVEDISQRLKPFTKNMLVQPVEIVRLRKVQHLRRRISAELNYINDVDCLHWLQPTAAVAGLPRQAALSFILNNEPFNRMWYAGSAGYFSYKKSEFSVALRSALIEDNLIYFYAGAGIVSGSDPLYEWLEIENKASVLRSLLNEP